MIHTLRGKANVPVPRPDRRRALHRTPSDHSRPVCPWCTPATHARVGRTTDGRCPHLPRHSRAHRPGADAARRRPLLCPEQAVVLEADPEKARAIARAHTSVYVAQPNYVQNLRELGFTDADLEPAGGSDALVDALVAWGEAEAVVAASENTSMPEPTTCPYRCCLRRSADFLTTSGASLRRPWQNSAISSRGNRAQAQPVPPLAHADRRRIPRIPVGRRRQRHGADPGAISELRRRHVGERCQ